MSFSGQTIAKTLLAGVFTASGLTFLLPTPPAIACSCATQNSNEHFERANVIFTGKVISQGAPKIEDWFDQAAPSVRSTFEVDQVFKGNIVKQQQIVSLQMESACGIRFQLNERYQVFARRIGDTLVTDSCSGTKGLAQATSQESSVNGPPPVQPSRVCKPLLSR